MKSGVYFVHYDDIDAFLKEAEKAGRRPLSTSTCEQLKHERFKNLYRVFSIDSNDKSYGNRIGYWGAMTLDKMEHWKNWSYTDAYIEHWIPKKVLI